MPHPNALTDSNKAASAREKPWTWVSQGTAHSPPKANMIAMVLAPPRVKTQISRRRRTDLILAAMPWGRSARGFGRGRRNTIQVPAVNVRPTSIAVYMDDRQPNASTPQASGT